MKLNSLRTRFILAYAGLILVGFGAIALVVGRQISVSVRQNFEQQMVNQAGLVADGLETTLISYYTNTITEDQLNEAIASYEARLNATITILQTAPIGIGTTPNDSPILLPPPSDFNNAYPELSAARRGNLLVVERTVDGVAVLVTAVPINSRYGPLGILQLTKPRSQLQHETNQQWLILAVAILLIALVALALSVYLSLSLSRPLKTLQLSAYQLSNGNLDHRAPPFNTTELAEVSHAFNEMAAKLEAMFEEQRAFASNTSHELRTPLTTMRLRTEALRYEAALDNTTRQQYIQELDEELIRMSHMVEDLILLSRFDAGRATLGTEQIDMAAFARSLSMSLQPQLTQRQLQLDLSLPPTPLPTISASLNHLTIAYRNLLENAMKYTPNGGTISWQIVVDTQQLISHITDTGQGIDPDQLPHVFDRFYRADKARSRSIPGTGLGLALVKAIVQFYGGTIEISSPGSAQGTSVTIRWPY